MAGVWDSMTLGYGAVVLAGAGAEALTILAGATLGAGAVDLAGTDGTIGVGAEALAGVGAVDLAGTDGTIGVGAEALAGTNGTIGDGAVTQDTQ